MPFVIFLILLYSNRENIMNDENEEFPRLIFNSDGDSTTLSVFEPPITSEKACRDIEEVAGTGVDVFSNSMGRGDDTFSHPTEYGDLYGEGFSSWPEGEDGHGNLQWVRFMADNARALLDAEINIIELLSERAHQRGLQFWPALRMNDVHEDDGSRFAAFRSEFKKEHPDLLLGSPYPADGSYGYPQDNFTWAFNFAKEEVRDRKLGLILETCEKYDVDGFELDFQRGPWYFKEGKEQEGMPLLTDFMRKVRTGTREVADRKGRSFILIARIPPTLDSCLDIGLDAATWIQEELADLFVPMQGSYLDMGADIKGFVKMAQNTRCRIGGGIEHLAKGYRQAGPDMLYAAAMSFWHQGASSMYLFNYDCHRQLGADFPYTPQEIRVLKEISDPKILVRKDKRYCVCVDMKLRTPEEGGAKPLPQEIRSTDDKKSFTIWVGDDVESALRDGIPVDIWLRFTFAKGISENQHIIVVLNGEKMKEGHRLDAPACTTWKFPVGHVFQGENEISVYVEEVERDMALRIEGIELVITY